MPVFLGTLIGSIRSVPLTMPAVIRSFSITNKSVGSVTVTFGLFASGMEIYYKTVTIAAGASYGIDVTEIRMMAGTRIMIITTGTIDYYVSYDGI